MYRPRSKTVSDLGPKLVRPRSIHLGQADLARSKPLFDLGLTYVPNHLTPRPDLDTMSLRHMLVRCLILVCMFKPTSLLISHSSKYYVMALVRQLNNCVRLY